MNFEELYRHLSEECGCHIDKIADELYMVRNCVNGEHCLVEDLNFYSTPTICHYCYELNIDFPPEFEDLSHVYMNFREHVKGVGVMNNK